MPKNITLALCLLGAASFAPRLQAQDLVVPWINQQFTDNAGVPLSGGFVYSCASLGACPGTPLVTYTSSSGATANQNPIHLDGGGRASIWLLPSTSYQFVVTDSTGAVIPGAGGQNIYGALVTAPPSLAGCNAGSPATGTSEIQFYSSATALGCSPALTFNPTGLVLGVTGTAGQASIASYSGYFQSFDGYLSTAPGGGLWNAFNSPTDGAYLRGFTLAQTTANTSGGYFDIVPISYNPYNGAQCLDSYGNVVQQPLPLNGLAGFGPNDTLMWVGTSPSMPANGSCGVPLPVSPSQTYQGVANQSFGLFINSYFFARGGVATDNVGYNSFQALNGGAYLHLGLTTDQAFYPKAYAASTSLNNPSAGYGGLAYQGGSVWYYFNDVTATWNTVNLASGGGGGGSAQGPANALQANDASGAGMFTGYSWLLAIPGSQAISALGGFTTTSGAGACALSNCIQAPLGGLFAGLGVTAGQAFYPAAWATTSGLNPPASGYGGITYAGASVGSGATYRYYNASTPGWATVDFSTTGSGCTLGGTASGQVIFNLSGACASASTLAWNNSTDQLSIGGGSGTTQSIVITNGYGYANGGWNSGTCTAPTCLNSPAGGATVSLGYTAGQGFYSFNFAPVGGVAPGSLNNPATGYGGLAYAGSGLYWAWNGSAWYSWTPGSGGGGGSCPGGSANQVQYNNGGSACAGSANLTFASNVLNLNGSLTLFSSPSITTGNQFVGSGGVNTSGVITTSGGLAVNNTSIGAIQTTGTITAQGLSVANTAFNAIQTTGNIDACSAGGCSGGNAFAIAGTTVINSTGQFVGAGGVNTSGGITTSAGLVVNNSSFGSIQTTGTITAQGLSVANTAFNAIQTTGNIDACSSGSCSGGNAIAVGGTTVINNLLTFFPSGIIDSGGATITGGLVTGSSSNSTLYIGTGGNLYLRPVSGASTAISCSGIANGWMAVTTSDNYLVVCDNSGTRYRSALTAF